MDIRPLFVDWDANDPLRGATTRALEHILQYYMESEDYQKKLKTSEEFAKKFFNYLCIKDKEQIRRLLADVTKKA